MRVSGLIITHQLSDQAITWLSQTAKVVDELVAVVPEPRAAPNLFAQLEKIGARIHRTRWDTFYPSAEESLEMIAACNGEWILKVDHDEEPSAEWFSTEWRELLHGDISNYWVPRRWMLPSGNFLDLAPWWPDWQLRLFRNNPDEMTFPTELHESMLLSGPRGYLRTLALHHHDLWMATRAQREQKTKLYEELRPDKPLGYYYLYEESGSAGSAIPPTHSHSIAHQVLHMAGLSSEQIRGVELRPATPPAHVAARQVFWVDVEVLNQTELELTHGTPHPFNLAYHWSDAVSRQLVVFDGARTAIFPGLPAGEKRTVKMFIAAPRLPGLYVLQITAVQEHLAWLEAEYPHIAHEFTVRVA